MVLFEYILLFLVGYFFFKLVTKVVLPVMRTVRVVRREFAGQQGQQQRPSGTGTNGFGQSAGMNGETKKPTPNWDKMGDYIDFEEVK